MTNARAEIWESFISLLRAYAAASFAENASVTISANHEVLLAYRDRALRLRFESVSGNGSWQLLDDGTESQGEFQMHIDSTLEFADGPKALDLAAIEFVERLGKRNKIEVELPAVAVAANRPTL